MAPAADRPRILFLCTANSCRSQIAEGWARALRSDRIEPYSAGTTPRAVDPLAVQIMAEAGVDISAQRSKHVDSLASVPFDAFVTVCDAAKESCPRPPGSALILHRRFDDPPALARRSTTNDDPLSH